MSNEEISMEYDYIAEEEECPATPPSIPTITDAVVVDPFAQAIMLELESAAEPDSRQRTHRPQLSSAISGYETAKQNLTPIINREQRRDIMSKQKVLSAAVPVIMVLIEELCPRRRLYRLNLRPRIQRLITAGRGLTVTIALRLKMKMRK